MEEPAKTEWGRKALSEGLSAIEKLLKDTAGKYCVGDQVTLADIALIPQLNRFGVNTDDYPAISAISKRLEALPEFIAADGPNQPDHPSKHQA
jgi:glutathione S-transferase